MGVITEGQNQESQLEPYQDPPEDLMTQRVCSGACHLYSCQAPRC